MKSVFMIKFSALPTFFDLRIRELEIGIEALEKKNYFVGKGRLKELMQKTIQLNQHLKYLSLEGVEKIH